MTIRMTCRTALLGPALLSQAAWGANHPLFDSHFHVIDPRFPLVENQGYTPPPFALAAYLSAARPLGVLGGAVVSASYQGFDQSYLLETLGRLGAGWVGVAQIPSTMPDADIQQLGQAGVRALRFNIARGDTADFDAIFALAARAHAIAGWHAEFYADAAQLRPHVDRLARLPRLSIDHLGMTKAGLPVVIDLVGAGAFVKATGFGRVDFDVGPALEKIAAKNPKALVFGTDMPSTRARTPFAPADIDLIEQVLGKDLARMVFWDNPRALYRF